MNRIVGRDTIRKVIRYRMADRHEDTQAHEEWRALHGQVRGMHDEFVDFLGAMAGIESPTDRPETQAGVQEILVEAFGDLGFATRILPGRSSGGHFYAVPERRVRGRAAQLMIGHTDTVWPVDTLQEMPVRLDEGRLYGPGTLDMKGGLTQMVFALRALRALGREPEVTPVVFINSDEEIGSPESKPWVERISGRVQRAFVLEPALAPDGRIKTARKGVGSYQITIRGKAAHAGLEPEAGASAVEELSHVIQALHGLTDLEVGTTVNVGLVAGGTRENVVAPRATAGVDVRVMTSEAGRTLDEAIRSIRPVTPGVRIEVAGGIRVPPLERTPRNMRLWDRATQIASGMGLVLDHAMAGGGSDGNTTSQYTATLDGLGCVGDGPHALHEHIEVLPTLDRCALLAGLLMSPPDDA